MILQLGASTLVEADVACFDKAGGSAGYVLLKMTTGEKIFYLPARCQSSALKTSATRLNRRGGGTVRLLFGITFHPPPFFGPRWHRPHFLLIQPEILSRKLAASLKRLVTVPASATFTRWLIVFSLI